MLMAYVLSDEIIKVLKHPLLEIFQKVHYSIQHSWFCNPRAGTAGTASGINCYIYIKQFIVEHRPKPCLDIVQEVQLWLSTIHHYWCSGVGKSIIAHKFQHFKL